MEYIRVYPPDIMWWPQSAIDNYINLLEWAEKYEGHEVNNDTEKEETQG